MTPLKNLYVIRVILGIIAGVLSAVLAFFSGTQTTTTFINSITIALIVYLVSYYLVKAKFKNQIEKQSQILTMGIGMYFFTWLTSMIICFTFLYPYIT
jgi:hypothetical protein